MRGTMLLGVILLVAGLAGLAWPVISYTKTEKVVDLGPIEVTAEHQKHVPVPPIVGGLAAVAGLVIIVTSGRKA
jgi:UDP-N-acetylmuramyl pentapeptide phosphotransferase/UDP-N-acetylglucosamine-1-phosphate transferase